MRSDRSGVSPRGATPDENASVRVELAGDSGSLEAPESMTVGRRGRGGGPLVAAFAALVLVGLLIFSNRPDAGQTAAGTRVEAPTTTIEGGSPETGVGDTELSEPRGTEAPLNGPDSDETEVVPQGRQLADLASAKINFFPYSLVEAGLGWIVLGFANGEQGGLWRSVDGLDWDLIEAETLPDGDILGFDRIGGEYMLAVDELHSWSELPDDELDSAFRISVWVSPDAVGWRPHPTLPTLDGEGYPYPVSLSAEAYAVPSISLDADSAVEQTVSYLADVLPPEIAGDVCWSQTVFADGDEGRRFDDCDHNEIAVVMRADDVDAYEALGAEHCVEIIRSQYGALSTVAYVRQDGVAATLEVGSPTDLLGSLVGDVYITTKSPARNRSPDCRSSGGASDPASVVVWSPELGERQLDHPALATAAGAQSSIRLFFEGPDGSVRTIDRESVWEAEPPFDEWTSIVEQPEGSSHWSFGLDGSIVGATGDAVYWGDGGGDWTEAEAIVGSFLPLLSTDSFVVVMEETDEVTLIKIEAAP